MTPPWARRDGAHRVVGPPITPADVAEALHHGAGAAAVASLVSAAADELRPRLVQEATRRTRARFPSVELYAPLYVSNACTNRCTYCGFRFGNPIERAILDDQAIAREAEALVRSGIRSVLLVSGDAPALFGVDRLIRAIEIVRPHFDRVAIEVFPMAIDDYRRALAAGATGLALYQETYDPERYRQVHLAGRKRNYLWRLTAPERAARAGFEEISLGVLLGLADWREEAVWLARHVPALLAVNPALRLSFSFPRLRAVSGGLAPREHRVEDADLAHLMSALRIALPAVGANLSTRESPALRDRLGPRLATTMSAGSSTRPGGYAARERGTLAQFELADERSTREVADMLERHGVPVGPC